MIKSVLLAPNEQISFEDPRLKWPLYGSVKYDGVRCAIVNGQLLTRNMKPHKNKHLPAHLATLVAFSIRHDVVFDLEIYDHSLGNFGDHTSILAAHEKPIPSTMHAYVFDMIPGTSWRGEEESFPYDVRYECLIDAFRQTLGGQEHIKAVQQIVLHGPDDAKAVFEAACGNGFEGLMLRSPDSPYKHGRATLKEGIIYKFKQFETIDGRIVEVMQRRKMKEEVRTGERTLTPTGHTEKIHTKDSYDLDEMVGAFKVLFPDGTISEVNYGRGFPHDERREHWATRQALTGRMVEVRHLPHGASDGIRIGTLVRFRPDLD